jgi:hypothetical protein
MSDVTKRIRPVYDDPSVGGEPRSKPLTSAQEDGLVEPRGSERPDLFRLAAALGPDFAATVLPGANALNVFREPLARPVRLRIRVDVVGAQPQLWRRLTVPSNFRLDAVHEVLQIAFGWANTSTHRFSVGERWDLWAGRAILSSGEVESDAPGMPESELRLDQVIAKPGDVLRYRYGAADQRELRIKVEAVEYLRKTDAGAHCLAGRRAGPPEGAGGIRSYDHLLAVVAGPDGADRGELADVTEEIAQRASDDRFDWEEVNRALEALEVR